MKLGIYRTGWKQFNLVNLCVDIQRVFSFVRINCDPVFSNGCFEAKKNIWISFCFRFGKITREPCEMVKSAVGENGIWTVTEIWVVCFIQTYGNSADDALAHTGGDATRLQFPTPTHPPPQKTNFKKL